MEKNYRDEINEIRKELYRVRRRLRFCQISVIASLSVLGLGAASSSLLDLRVRRLALVDAKGVERLILDADNKYATVNGKRVARGPAISGLILQNARGDEIGGMASMDNGMAAILLDGYAKETRYGQTERIGLFSAPDGTAGFMLNDLKGKGRARIISGTDMSVTFTLLDQNEQPQIQGKVSGDGTTEWKTNFP